MNIKAYYLTLSFLDRIGNDLAETYQQYTRRIKLYPLAITPGDDDAFDVMGSDDENEGEDVKDQEKNSNQHQIKKLK